MGSRNNERYHRLELFHRLSSILSKPTYRFRDPESRLHAFSHDGYHIKESRFKNALFAVYHFDDELSCLLSALYRCLPGAEIQAADYRYFLCGLQLYSQSFMIRSKPVEFLLHLLRTFEHMNGKIQTDKILYIISCAAVNHEEVKATAGALSLALQRREIGCSVKSNLCWIQVPDVLIEALKTNPHVLRAFISTVLLNVVASQMQPEKIVAERNLHAENTSKSSTYGIHEDRAMVFHLSNLYKRYFIKWVGFTMLNKNRLYYMTKMEEEVVRIRLRHWKRWVEKRVRLRIMQRRTVRLGRRAIMKRSWVQLYQNTKDQRVLFKATWKHTLEGEKTIQASTALRCMINGRKVRSGLQVWRDTAMGMLAWEIAANFNDKRFKYKIIHAWKKCSELAIHDRKVLTDAAERASALHSALMEAEVEKEMLAKAKEVTTSQMKAEAKAALMLQRKEKTFQQRTLEEEKLVEASLNILNIQARERNQFKATQMAEMKHSHEKEWEIRIEEACRSCVASMRRFLGLSNNALQRVALKGKLSSEARNLLDKEISRVRRLLTEPPTLQGVRNEANLQNPMNAVVAYIKASLHKSKMTLQGFFKRYEGFERGFIRSTDFKQLIKSIGLDLTFKQMNAMLLNMSPTDMNFVSQESILKEFTRCEELCGFIGSPWMIYVHPEENIIVMHNVARDKKVWDYKAKESDLIAAAQDNIIGAEWERCRQISIEGKLKDWENKLQVKAATSIQRMFWAWKGRKARASSQWISEAHKLREQNTMRKTAAISLQCWWRTVLAVKKASVMLQLCVEKLVDPASLQAYYFNHSTQQAEWSKPLLLQRLPPDLVNPLRNKDDADLDIDDPLPKWVSIVRETSAVYFFNTLSGDVEENPPPGYIRCEHCQLQLARRCCNVERRRLCFHCFREQHTSSPSAWKHHWKMLDGDEAENDIGV